MKCPFCGTEMLHGYLNCGSTLWSEQKHKRIVLPEGKEKYALHLESRFCFRIRLKAIAAQTAKKLSLTRPVMKIIWSDDFRFAQKDKNGLRRLTGEARFDLRNHPKTPPERFFVLRGASGTYKIGTFPCIF